MSIRWLALAGAALAAVAPASRAQHMGPGRAPADTGARPDTTPMRMSGPMTLMQGPLGISMARQGSGTSWLPDATPMYGWHATAGPWLFMFHGNGSVQYIEDGSDRGHRQLGSVNWAMGMARRPLAGGDLTLRAMMSAEASTVGRCGYPDLLATGEFCHGQPLHDRQHPHDMFMDLSLGYQRAISRHLAFQIYGGPVGEPALGPVAFPHRLSALPNPIAPISHHWLDATHISFGVVTAGLYGNRWKIEGSVFNGREPDEDRYDIDLNRLDSYSGRVWFLPNDAWAIQASVGRLVDAEQETASAPLTSLTRSTLSATYHRTLGPQSIWANTVAWGANIESAKTTQAGLAESNLTLHERDIVFARVEVNGKTGHDLALPLTADSASQRETFTLGKVAVGYTRQFAPVLGLMPGIGASVSLDLLPRGLEPYYGATTEGGFAVFLSFRPARMTMASPHRMEGM
ncbi:MAG TPA: hypothetical protein VJO52_16480 [Gemmatimonadaceae bacterium]|nr:hypothetical protein [Gemmatimonadaceae bacterium]